MVPIGFAAEEQQQKNVHRGCMVRTFIPLTGNRRINDIISMVALDAQMFAGLNAI